MTTTPTPPPSELIRRDALMHAIMTYREQYEDDDPVWWFGEAVADLAHLWVAITGTDEPESFIDAITKGLDIAKSERASLKLSGRPIP
jgi:hypothetical protein